LTPHTHGGTPTRLSGEIFNLLAPALRNGALQFVLP
jgi:hypothetical protein